MTISTVNTILFDFDGTLLDSRDGLVYAAYRTIQHFEADTIPFSDVQQHYGTDFSSIFARMDCSLEDAWNFFINEKSLTYHHHQLFPYVKEGLAILRNQGIRLGIVSNQLRDLVMLSLKVHNMEDMFDVIVTRNDVMEVKPSPIPIFQAINKLNVLSEQVIMVGDTNVDMLSASQAYVKSILFKFYEETSYITKNPTHGTFFSFHEFVESFCPGGKIAI